MYWPSALAAIVCHSSDILQYIKWSGWFARDNWLNQIVFAYKTLWSTSTRAQCDSECERARTQRGNTKRRLGAFADTGLFGIQTHIMNTIEVNCNTKHKTKWNLMNEKLAPQYDLWTYLLWFWFQMRWSQFFLGSLIALNHFDMYWKATVVMELCCIFRIIRVWFVAS